MSIFRTISVACPQCGKTSNHDAVYSVNADRRPDLRDEILEEDFQRRECPSCASPFRLDPEFAYVDAEHRIWIAAYPLARLGEWKALEGEAQAAFDTVYGPDASEHLQAMGRSMLRRATFGWAGLREKLVISGAGLDDITVELCKAAILRESPSAPVDGRVDLRLMEADDKRLRFGWIAAADEETLEVLGFAREAYQQIADDADGDWADLRDDLSEGLYTDLNRLMLG